MAHAVGAGVIVRIEDHDRGRSRAGYETGSLSDLAWLGFPCDDPSMASLERRPSPFRQSDCDAAYQAGLELLIEQGLVYGCGCSRSVIAAQIGDGVGAGCRRLRSGSRIFDWALTVNGPPDNVAIC